MTSRSFSPHVVLLTFLVIFAAGTSAVAQDGKLRLHVNPKQAYLWVDDRAVSEASKHPSLELSALGRLRSPPGKPLTSTSP
jgi:hypothetical protein